MTVTQFPSREDNTLSEGTRMTVGRLMADARAYVESAGVMARGEGIANHRDAGQLYKQAAESIKSVIDMTKDSIEPQRREEFRSEMLGNYAKARMLLESGMDYAGVAECHFRMADIFEDRDKDAIEVQRHRTFGCAALLKSGHRDMAEIIMRAEMVKEHRRDRFRRLSFDLR